MIQVRFTNRTLDLRLLPAAFQRSAHFCRRCRGMSWPQYRLCSEHAWRASLVLSPPLLAVRELTTEELMRDEPDAKDDFPRDDGSARRQDA
jgi:hypothetical protein